MKEQAKIILKSQRKKTTANNPIFYDDSKLRGKIFLLMLAALVGGFIYIQWQAYNLIFTNDAPSILFADKGLDTIEVTQPNFTETTAALNSKFPSKLSDRKRVAFYVAWDDASLNSLKQNIKNIDILIPEFFIVGADKSIVSIDRDDEKYIVAYAKNENPDIKVVPLINNFNSEKSIFDPALISDILKDKATREDFINRLHDHIVSNEFDGINIDFEEIPVSQQYAYINFMKELKAKFEQSDLLVTQDVPLNNVDYNYREYAKYNDYLIFMAYDYNWSTGKAGPIAPLAWIQSSLSRIQKNVPGEKVIIALGSYGYNWENSNAAAINKTYSEALILAQNYNTEIELDPVSSNLFFKYTDGNKVENTIWLLDSVTFYNQTVEINKYPFAGIALWRLGSEDQNVWDIMKDPSKPFDNLTALSSLSSGVDTRIVGSGEITKVQALPSSGERNLSIDANTGKIVKAEIVEYPIPYTIQKWGGLNNKKVALTFDDGPDPVYTREISKILKENGIKATFFIVGSQANINPGIVESLYKDGHEIGNHTYLHSNIENSSFNKIFPELNATQLLIEDITGHKSFLFRAPFSTKIEVTSDALKFNEELSNLGYYDVGINVDPRDWMSRDSDKIVEQVVSEVTANTTNSIVLLHDGGGNRSYTVDALPEIIKKLKDSGYTFGTVSEIMQVDKNIVMPPTPSAFSKNFSFDKIEFSIITMLAQFFATLFLIGLYAGGLKSLITLVLALMNKRRELKAKYNDKYLPKVSVIVPAWNEEKVIKKTVNTLLKNKYPKLEIIVVDDGSTDNTYAVALEAYKDHPNVKVLTTVINGGKSSAINFAMKKCTSTIFIVQDADTVLAPDAISKLVRHMDDQNVAAVAGNVKVGNRTNLLTKFQALEYIISQNLDRRAFHILNAISVVPGAIGAWRKRVVTEAGGFHSDTLAEDAELTLRILNLGYKIENEPDAIGYTEAPETFKIFVKQRFRWMFGTLQAVWKVRYAALNVKNWALGFVVIPNVFIFQIVLSILSPFLDLYVILSLAFAMWQKSVNPEISFNAINIILTYYVLFTLVDILVGTVAFYMENRESKKLLLYIPLQRIFHKYMMYFVSLKAIYTAINGPHVKWEIKKRQASVDELLLFTEAELKA